MPSGGERIGTVLGEHLQAHGLPRDSGVAQRWVRVRFVGIPIVFPNFDARRRVLVLHDVHHLLTGYPTTWRGEAEIGAFEIATGCGDLWAAWMFNLGGFLFGLAIAPVATWRAFVRGCHCTNCYGEPEHAVLAQTVAAAKARLGLDRPPPRARARDAARFVSWAGIALAAALAPLAAAVAAAWWLLS